MLVVIAIIGLLSSVVLVALGPARNKAKDARIISDVNQARAVAETLYNPSTGKYESTLNVTQREIGKLNDDVKSNNGGTDLKVNGGGTAAYAISAKLNTGFYCIDSTGKVGSNDAGTGTDCP